MSRWREVFIQGDFCKMLSQTKPAKAAELLSPSDSCEKMSLGSLKATSDSSGPRYGHGCGVSMALRASFFCADFHFTCPQRLHLPARTWRSFQASQAGFKILAIQRLKGEKKVQRLFFEWNESDMEVEQYCAEGHQLCSPANHRHSKSMSQTPQKP